MRIAVPRETAVGERRVALVPDNVARLAKQGHEIAIERDAGVAAGHADAAYAAAGAAVRPDPSSTMEGAAVVARVRGPDAREAETIPTGALLIGLLAAWRNAAVLDRLAARGVDALAMERVPRTTRSPRRRRSPATRRCCSARTRCRASSR